MKILLAAILFFSGSIASVHALEQDRETCGNGAQQGALVLCQLMPSDKIWLDGREVMVAANGMTVFGIARDQLSAELLIKRPGHEDVKKQLLFESRAYQIERVNGLPPKTVTVPDGWKKRRAIENGRVAAGRAVVSADQYWRAVFLRPAEGRISGVYGSQRILNGKPRSPHYGLDIANDVGTPVRAPATGIVRLAASDFLLEGGIVIIDHGHGVTSTLFHMDTVIVKEGDIIDQGDPIGTIGAKGRASGPHVDWRMNWLNVRLDPGLAIGISDEKSGAIVDENN